MCWAVAKGRVDSSFLPLLSFLSFFVLLPAIDSLLKSGFSRHGYLIFRSLISEIALRVYNL